MGTKHIVPWLWVVTVALRNTHATAPISLHNPGGTVMVASLAGRKASPETPSAGRIKKGQQDVYDIRGNGDYQAASIHEELWKRLVTGNITTDTVLEGAAYQDLVAYFFRSGICSKLKNRLAEFVSGTFLGHTLNPPCYPVVGCFYYNQNMRLKFGPPSSPEEVNATFYFFNKNSGRDLEDLLKKEVTVTRPEKTWTLQSWSHSKMTDPLTKGQPLIVVTHGYKGSKTNPWMLPLVKALLENLDCTVLVVDWNKGAQGYYRSAAANAPMAGVLISLFLQKILTETEGVIDPDNITLIGHSLGAHVMGFAGRHFQNATGMQLGRITALDPAGYLFENDTCSLSKTDAKFVDAIHTDGGGIQNLHFGIQKQVGHVDFYPNNGSSQPGCGGFPSSWDVSEYVACSHSRAIYLYIDSLTNTGCSFSSYSCTGWEPYVNGACRSGTQQNKIGIMGYYSFTAQGRGTQFLATNGESPFCRGNTDPPKEHSETTPQSILAKICNK